MNKPLKDQIEYGPPAWGRRILIVDDNQAIHDAFRQILGEESSEDDALKEMEAALFGDRRDPTPQPGEDAGHRRPEDQPPAGAGILSQPLGFELDSAFQGVEALECVRRAKQTHPYAMAFVDVRMPPGWDGIETIQRLWNEDPDLQFVICSAYNDYSWDQLREVLGESDRVLILKKPFDAIEVRQLATALTAKWNLAREVKLRLEELQEAMRERTEALQTQQKELEKTHAQLLHAQKLESIGQLAAGIAHEINTPTQFVGDNTRFLMDAFHDLRSILDPCRQLIEAHGTRSVSDGPIRAGDGPIGHDGSVEPALIERIGAAIQEADLDYLMEEIPKAIEQTLEGVERVARIVRSMKEFSHPGVEEKTSVDLNRAIETTITVARNEWKYVAEMVTNFDPSLPPVSCLPGDFNQVVLNLIINAAHAIANVVGDAGGAKGTITVSTRHDDEVVEVRVADTGTGIPPEIRGKIFDPFFTTKEVGKGTGQGLAIARSVIVDKHGGAITCESEVGVGTTFIVRLPIHAGAEEDASRGTRSVSDEPRNRASDEPAAGAVP